MRFRQLGNSDLHVSEIALGSWLTYGVSVDREATRDCVQSAFELGINFFDTANMYGRGAAESLLGELLSPYKRDQYILATKVYFPMSDTDQGLSRAQIHKQIDASLQRLRTDYVDLYQCHRFDYDTPLEETMRAMSEVVDAGKARYIGFSEWSPRRIKSANAIEHVKRFVSSQPQYSMLYRKPEPEVFPLCKKLGIGQIVWSPLAQGVLTGKYTPNERPPSNSRAAARGIRRFTEDRVLESVQRLRPIAERLSLSMSQLALAWVLKQECVSSAIIGATHPQQIHQNVAAVGVELDDATLREIDDVLDAVVRR
ncbi:L-glyceraldehyde 3-phosphate reductase [Novipirellula galeiformis]|uniref:L-glyceraldehyde 3-phosphate reductase n=1 Tax=Novipirellula galeiformis TaxID=2528004 RepID=A0A5C6C8K0_9BACT|nr:aldo/keto reductase family protein [Novipirellula galeiformis]TWU20492.1 L-glyceraldehyde 3-phosphate reductase [Novipirellula galeiformis]